MDPHRFIRRPAWWAAVALLMHGLLLVVAPASWRVNESSDFREVYEPTARQILAGAGPVDASGQLVTRYPPGYPAVLAVALGLAGVLPGDEGFWIQVLDALAIAATGALGFLLARRLVGSRIAPWAAALWVTYPPLLWLGKQPNSETPFLPVLLGGLVAWGAAIDQRDDRLAFLAGCLAGLATWIRPVALLLALPLAVSALWRHRRAGLRLAVWVLVGQAIVLLPWEVWAWHETGKWLPVSSGGRLSLLDGLTFAVDPEADRSAVSPDVAAMMDAIQADRRMIGGPVDAARWLADRAADEPWPVVSLLATKAGRAWYGTESMRRERVLLGLQIGYGLLAIAGLWWGRQRQRHLEWPVVVVGYFWLMACLVLSILRYMVPAMALVLPFAAEALVVMWDEARRRIS